MFHARAYVLAAALALGWSFYVLRGDDFQRVRIFAGAYTDEACQDAAARYYDTLAVRGALMFMCADSEGERLRFIRGPMIRS